MLGCVVVLGEDGVEMGPKERRGSGGPGRLRFSETNGKHEVGDQDLR